MSKCKKCNLEILDDTNQCPFCKHVLEKATGTEKNSYPNARVAVKRFRLFSNIVLFLSILATCLCIYADYRLKPNFGWSLVVMLVLIYVNVLLRLSLVGKSSYQFKVLSLVVMGILVFVGIDFLTRYRCWSVNYVLPSGIIFIDGGILVLMIVNHRNWQSYMMMQILMILASIVPLVLMYYQVISNGIWTLIAFAFSVFLFLGTLIIGDRRARTELKRRFHI